jgi:hypothetical protein
MDYRKFLGQSEEQVLPYFGGPFVDAPDRRLRVAEPFEPPGWYRFKVEGRSAARVGPADAPELTACPKVRGWFHRGHLVRDGAVAETLWLLPAEEPARFNKVAARRWRTGELLFEEVEFESEVEGLVREALAAGGSLSAVKGVPAPLRAAFAYALLEEASRRLHLRFSPAEVRQAVVKIAEGGPAAAEAELRRLEAERVLARRELDELRRRQQEAAARGEIEREREARRAEARERIAEPEEHARAALEAAGARLESARLLGRHQLEVVFRFMDERFISIVELGTLQVIDSGICLGHPPSDRLVTLESLPAVIKEAIDTGALVILRHP